MAEAMLDCVQCGSRNWLELEAPKAEELKSTGATRLRCGTCNRETDWKIADYSRRTGRERRAHPEPPRPQSLNRLPVSERISIPTSPETVHPRSPAPPVFQPERRGNLNRRQSSRRKHERASLRLPIRIRVNSLSLEFSEVTTTLNVSRTGVYFQSAQPYTEGLRVRVTLNYSPENAGAGIEQPGTVIRVESDPKTGLNRVAIRFL